MVLISYTYRKPRCKLLKGVCVLLSVGDSNYGWETSLATNLARGLLCIMGIKRKWKDEAFCRVIINVYSQYCIEGKRTLLNLLRQERGRLMNDLWCVTKDFNVVRS